MIPLKPFYLFICLLLISCDKAGEDKNYLQEYIKYEPLVAGHLKNIDSDLLDSATAILNIYLDEIRIYSCLYCVTEKEVFDPVSGFARKHPQMLTLILDRALQGTRLSFGFRALFKEFYPEKFKDLLLKENIHLLPEEEIKNEDDRWENKVKEGNLPFELLTEEYLNILSEA